MAYDEVKRKHMGEEHPTLDSYKMYGSLCFSQPFLLR